MDQIRWEERARRGRRVLTRLDLAAGLSKRTVRSMVDERSGPTDTMDTGTPKVSCTNAMYSMAFEGMSWYVRAALVSACHPGNSR
jgi:hypothetical protein